MLIAHACCYALTTKVLVEAMHLTATLGFTKSVAQYAFALVLSGAYAFMVARFIRYSFPFGTTLVNYFFCIFVVLFIYLYPQIIGRLYFLEIHMWHLNYIFSIRLPLIRLLLLDKPPDILACSWSLSTQQLGNIT